MNIKIKVTSGDVTRYNADAMITAINSERMWFGGIDGAIQRVAGNHYHSQAIKEQLSNLKTIVATGDRKHHDGAFDNVVFVVDDLESPLRYVIVEGLEACDDEGYEIVSIPGIRTGVMLGVVERSLEKVVDEYINGIKRYVYRTASIGCKPRIKLIRFVIYNNSKLETLLNEALRNEGWL